MDIPSDIRAAEEGSRDAVKTAIWAVWFFGSILLAMYEIRRYPLLDDRVYIVLLVALPVFFAASFLVPQLKQLNRFPMWMNVSGRLGGFAIPAVVMVWALILIANCWPHQNEEIKVLTCVEKRITRQRQPSYYIRVRPWNYTGREADLHVPKEMYAKISNGSLVRVVIGKGKLGLEWVRSVELNPVQPVAGRGPCASPSCRHKIPAGDVAIYRIESSGDQFVVIDPFDEVVDWFATEDAAEQSIAHCQKQDAMHGSAKLLIESAVTAHSECGVGEPSEAVGTSIRSTAQLSGVRGHGSSTGKQVSAGYWVQPLACVRGSADDFGARK
jgi:hypothetical protein